MPTIAELKELAKANGVYIQSRWKKGEIETELRNKGVEFAVSAPRSPPKAKTNQAVSVPTTMKQGALVELTIVQEDSAVTYFIPYSDIPNLAKLKQQIKLPMSEREIVDKELNVDYIEQLFEKSQYTVEDGEGFEPSGDEYIAFSANVVYF